MNDRPYKTDGRLPAVCCGNCPYGLQDNQNENQVECHHGPDSISLIAVPEPTGRVKLDMASGEKIPEMQIREHWSWAKVRKNQVCGQHPLFNQHPQMVQFNEDHAELMRKKDSQ